MNAYTNTADIGLAMAVWLAHDEYSSGANEHEGQNVISATGLLKPIRQLVLSNRVPPSDRQVDVSDFIASRLGHAIHDSIEHAWKRSWPTAPDSWLAVASRTRASQAASRRPSS
jgi:hypothetical protein